MKCAEANSELVRRPDVEETNHRHRRLLRTRSKRPRNDRAAGNRDELAPPHVLPKNTRIAPYHTPVGNAGLCITANLAANVSVGSDATKLWSAPLIVAVFGGFFCRVLGGAV